VKIVPLTNRLPTDYLPGIDTLTRSERRVVNLMCAGLTQSEMAKEMGVSDNSVRISAHTAYQKIGVSNQIQLMSLIIMALMPTTERLD